MFYVSKIASQDSEQKNINIQIHTDK